MKKQLFRVKQLADQTFSRAGKTEKLSDDLQAAEKRVDFIRTACQNTGKKLTSSLLGQGQDAAAREKRLKKSSEYSLGVSMLECSTFDEDFLLRNVVVECGKLEMCLANAYVDHEAKVESNVVAMLQQICDTDVPNIIKQRRNLTKFTLDMDSARTRYQAALKHSTSSGAVGSKLDALKDELEEAETKVEQCRDMLACEMFQLISRESDIATTVLEYAKLQRTYHQNALTTLDEMIPELETNICDSSVKPVFGFPLEDHLRVTRRKIAYPIELCVCALLELGMDEEGLFRVAGGASKMRRMKLSFDAGCMEIETAMDYRDPHIIAGVLKSYLRELPEPLMTHQLYDEWMAAARVPIDARAQALWTVVQKLPKANLDNLRYLVKFLSLLARNHESNKMTPQNIAIVIAPNLIWSPADDGNNIGLNMNTANVHSIIVDSLVSYADWFFPEDCEMYITVNKERAAMVNGHTRSSSADTQLITVNEGGDMKRTQSNSSLSDHNNSPPQGSPKPAVRVRKNKPAPGPPKDADRHNASKNTPDKSAVPAATTTPTNQPQPQPATNPAVNQDSTGSSAKQSVVTNSAPPEKQDSVIDNQIPVVPDEDLAKQSEPTSEKDILIGFEKLVAETEVIERKDDICEKELSTSLIAAESLQQSCQGDVKQTPSKPTEGFKGSVDPAYGTLDRKRPPRPTPLPRTSIMSTSGSDEVMLRKPVVPERPATLQRPHSSSFRVPRNSDSGSDTGEKSDNGLVSLERAHVYCVDKQQVAIIQVGNGPKQENNKSERRDSTEKPERPPKPEVLPEKSQVLMHRRTPSEGHIIDQGINVPSESPRSITRAPPRPTIPPPPNPQSAAAAAASASAISTAPASVAPASVAPAPGCKTNESTNL